SRTSRTPRTMATMGITTLVHRIHIVARTSLLPIRKPLVAPQPEPMGVHRGASSGNCDRATLSKT
ncbi:MAG: hypothetical protein M3R16_07170, partial [Pseudomonadota bacterium]|nr:hypothetical protein [Pseudomonadota bacterium]